METTLRARWFDGNSGRARPVVVHLAAQGRQRCSLRLHPLDNLGDAVLQIAPGDYEWPDTWEPDRGASTLTVDLRAHGSLQVDGAAWQLALDSCGVNQGIAQRLQGRWRHILVALVAAVMLGLAFARWGTPWAAAQLTRLAPLSWELEVSSEALAQLDARRVLKPSKLPAERQAQLRASFQALLAQMPPQLRSDATYVPVFALQFRSGIGPNALALPGGTMVLTDAMVELARDKDLGDDALMGVLAHEAGHVVHRHGTRRVIELGLLNGVMALAFGDVSAIANSVGTVMAGLAYSRAHEREADCFAIAFMRDAQRPLAPMAQLLEAAHEAHSGSSGAGMLGEWAGTHPDTEGRVRDLKAGNGASCPRA